MKDKVINTLIKILIDFLSPEIITKVILNALDDIEDFVRETETDYDNRLILPIIQTIREIIE